MSQTYVSPASTKKLVQACLPFKPLNVQTTPPSCVNSAPKKRRLNDGTATHRVSKSLKKEEGQKSGKQPDPCIDDKEVSSSCELKNVPVLTVPEPSVKAGSLRKVVKSLDQFVHTTPTQQLEVSTSCNDGEIIDLTAGEEEINAVSTTSPSAGDVGDVELMDCGKDEINPTVANSCDEPSGDQCLDRNMNKSVEVGSSATINESASAVAQPCVVSCDDDKIMTPEKDEKDPDNSSNVSEMDSEKENIKDTDSVASSDDVSFCSKAEEAETAAAPSELVDAAVSETVSLSAQKPNSDQLKNSATVSADKTSVGSVAKEKAHSKPKSLDKGEREKLRQEKQRLKEEKERSKALEKEKREREKQEAKESKERERLEKEREKAEKKKQKEDEKLQKKEQLLQEKKMKEEAKLEEKKKKEEKKEQELCLKEKELMQRFFKTSAKEPACTKSQEVKVGPFMDFQVKENMRLAPRCRVEDLDTSEMAAGLDKHLQQQDCSVLYLDDLRNGAIRHKSPATWPSTDDDIAILPEVGSTACSMHAKLLQFHENYRPAYYGTWRKRSRLIRGRNPWRQDSSFLDYEVDSDEEWEEEEPGESLSHSEDDGEDEDVEPDPDEEGDGFFVPHGYLSEGEGCEDDDENEASPEKRKAQQLARARRWEDDVARGKKNDVVRPFVIGICWWSPEQTADPLINKLQEFKTILFVTPPIETNSRVAGSSDGKCDKSEKKLKSFMPVPDCALPDLVRLVHGNEWSIHKLVREFCEFWRRKIASVENAAEGATGSDSKLSAISKRQLEAKIREIAVYERREHYPKRKLWYVNASTIEPLNLNDLPIPTKWEWITKLPSKAELKAKHDHKQSKDGASNAVAEKDVSHKCSIKSFMTDKISQKRNGSSAMDASSVVVPGPGGKEKHPQLTKPAKLKIFSKKRGSILRHFASPVVASLVCDDAQVSGPLCAGNPRVLVPNVQLIRVDAIPSPGSRESTLKPAVPSDNPSVPSDKPSVPLGKPPQDDDDDCMIVDPS